MTTKTQPTVTVEQFTRDVWEATREQMRTQLGGVLDDEIFDQQIPSWENLTQKARDEKVRYSRTEMLGVIDLAGYEVRRKL